MPDQWDGYTSLEICAGAGGQAVGLHEAGFRHRALIEVDPHAVRTLEHNTRRHGWQDCAILPWDLTDFDMGDLKKVLGDEPLVCWPAGFPVRPSPWPASSSARTTSAICSPSCSIWPRSFSPGR